jgi:hypothetical protein
VFWFIQLGGKKNWAVVLLEFFQNRGQFSEFVRERKHELHTTSGDIFRAGPFYRNAMGIPLLQKCRDQNRTDALGFEINGYSSWNSQSSFSERPGMIKRLGRIHGPPPPPLNQTKKAKGVIKSPNVKNSEWPQVFSVFLIQRGGRGAVNSAKTFDHPR